MSLINTDSTLHHQPRWSPDLTAPPPALGGSGGAQPTDADLARQLSPRPGSTDGLPAPDTAGGLDSETLTRLDALLGDSATLDLYQVALLSHRFAVGIKQIEIAIRNSDAQAAIHALLDAANEVRAAAEDTTQAGLANANSQIASGVAEGAMGAAALRAAYKAGEAAKLQQQKQQEINKVRQEIPPGGGLNKKDFSDIDVHDKKIKTLQGQRKGGTSEEDQEHNRGIDKQIREEEEAIQAIEQRPQLRAEKLDRLENEAAKLGTQAANWRALQDALGMFSRALASIAKGGGDWHAALKQFDAALHDVRNKELSAHSEGLQSSSQRAGDGAATAQDLIRAVRELLQAFLQAITDANRQISAV